ncbi:MAG TPA: ABC-2 family transporter protein [Chloroflexota bacterium]|nr:ABC-2 family transporter protein [Chloroflexota bacterium]
MVASVRRVFQLWGLYARLDMLYVLRGPQIALSFYVSDLILGMAAVTAMFLLAQRFDGIPPWSRDQMLFLLGYALLVRGTIDVFFNYNISFISRRIGRGQLDHVLVQPQPLWMVLLTEGFAPVTGAGMLLPGLLLIGWSVEQLQLSITFAWLALLALSLACSIVVVLAFSYAWGSLAFWAPRSAEELNSSTWQLLTQLDVFPLDPLPTLALTGLLTFVPAGLVAWYPARALLGIDASPLGWLGLPAAALVLGSLCLFIFMRGLAHYGRTGSTRYLSYGHRR